MKTPHAALVFVMRQQLDRLITERAIEQWITEKYAGNRYLGSWLAFAKSIAFKDGISEEDTQEGLNRGVLRVQKILLERTKEERKTLTTADEVEDYSRTWNFKSQFGLIRLNALNYIEWSMKRLHTKTRRRQRFLEFHDDISRLPRKSEFTELHPPEIQASLIELNLSLAKLSPEDRCIIEQRLDGYTFKAIAQLKGKSIGTISKVYSKAIALLPEDERLFLKRLSYGSRIN